jgi:hypothetical protein
MLCGFLLCRVVLAYFERLQDSLREELTKLALGEPCQSGSVLMAMGKTVGQAAGQNVRASLMQNLGRVSALENGAATDTQLELIQGRSPLLGAALSGLGTRGAGKLLNNPLVQLALQALAPRGNGAEQSSVSGQSSVGDRLKRGQG